MFALIGLILRYFLTSILYEEISSKNTQSQHPSYRLKNICRIRTNNKNPVLRLLFVGISFLLVNIWVNILWLRISRKRKGSRFIYRTLFVLKQMLAFLSQAIQRKYQVVESIYIPTG
jgi:putative transposase